MSWRLYMTENNIWRHKWLHLPNLIFPCLACLVCFFSCDCLVLWHRVEKGEEWRERERDLEATRKIGPSTQDPLQGPSIGSPDTIVDIEANKMQNRTPNNLHRIASGRGNTGRQADRHRPNLQRQTRQTNRQTHSTAQQKFIHKTKTMCPSCPIDRLTAQHSIANIQWLNEETQGNARQNEDKRQENERQEYKTTKYKTITR